MDYVSTRGSAPTLGFEDVTLAGLASDGGLYVPRVWPIVSREVIAGLAGKSYVETAVTVMLPFVGDALSEDELRSLCTQAYGRFAHGAVTPLVQLDERQWLLELFHGPTLAFKDVALQLLGLLFERFLSGRDTHLTVIGATSGDTGSAAIDALAGRAKVDVFMLHPAGRVSDVQRRQMTTVLSQRIHIRQSQPDPNIGQFEGLFRELLATDFRRFQIEIPEPIQLRLRSIFLCFHNTSLIPFVNNREFLTLPQSTHLLMPDEHGQTIVLF